MTCFSPKYKCLFVLKLRFCTRVHKSVPFYPPLFITGERDTAGCMQVCCVRANLKVGALQVQAFFFFCFDLNFKHVLAFPQMTFSSVILCLADILFLLVFFPSRVVNTPTGVQTPWEPWFLGQHTQTRTIFVALSTKSPFSWSEG